MMEVEVIDLKIILLLIPELSNIMTIAHSQRRMPIFAVIAPVKKLHMDLIDFPAKDLDFFVSKHSPTKSYGGDKQIVIL